MGSAIGANTEPYDFKAALSAFVELGGEIISMKPAERYGYQFNNRFLLQPGFIPLKAPPKVVFIGINPSTNKLGQETVDLDEERRLYLGWAKHRTMDAYAEAYETWAMQNVRGWTVFRTVREVLERNGLSPENGDLGWLNIAKVPDNDMSAITEQIATRDFPWLKRQLRMMGPDIFVVLGSNASRYGFIANYLQRSYPNRVGVRGQRGDGESVDAIVARLQFWLERK